MNKKYEFDFVVDEKLVIDFSTLTSDRNPLHMDDQFASQSRYRKKIAHGMILVHALGPWLAKLGRRSITQIKGKFLQPAFIGDEISLKILYNDDVFDANFRDKKKNRNLAIIKGNLGEIDNSWSEPSNNQIWSDSIQLNSLSLADLKGWKEALNVKDLFGLNNIFSQGDSPVNNQVACLSLLSTVVGMRAPGEKAIFTDFEANFGRSFREGGLSYEVSKVFNSSSRLKISGCFGSVDNPFTVNAVLDSDQLKLTNREELKEQSHLTLNGKTILILGGTSGIGSEAARLFSLLGAKVLVHYNKGVDRFESLKNEFPQIEGLQADLGKQEDVLELVASLQNTCEQLDVLINCVVGDFTPDTIDNLSWDDIVSEISLSIGGVYKVFKSVKDLIPKNSHSKVINLSSEVVEKPASGQVKYIVAKSALEGLSKSLATDFQQDGIEFNTLSPGMTATNLIKPVGDGVIRKVASEKMGGEILKPIQVAKVLAFMSSDWSNGMSGQNLSFYHD